MSDIVKLKKGNFYRILSIELNYHCGDQDLVLTLHNRC